LQFVHTHHIGRSAESAGLSNVIVDIAIETKIPTETSELSIAFLLTDGV
jgi:hypothetical protein